VTPEPEALQTAPAEIPALRRFAWLLRRELWESRWIYLAPFAVTGLILLGAVLAAFQMPAKMHRVAVLAPAAQHAALTDHYLMASLLLMATTFVVSLFYCLDAFQSERRDRSILFWKSLPISDREVVASKAITGLVATPLFVLAVAAVGQVLFALIIWARFGGSGHASLLVPFDFGAWIRVQGLFLAILPALILWYLPIAAYLLFVSVAVRRNAFLWALLPPAALLLIESILMPAHYFASFLGRRFTGVFQIIGQNVHGDDPNLGSIVAAIGHVFMSIETWLGVIVAGVAFVAIVRMRRYRDDS